MSQLSPVTNSETKNFTGSLTTTLVRTLLIFAFIPLLLITGATYFRARTLLREQAITQSENLLVNQLRVIEQEIVNKENALANQVASEEFRLQIELGLHANPQSDEFRIIRNDFIRQLQRGNIAFDQFILIGNDEIITVASNESWQGQNIDLDSYKLEKQKSVAIYGFAPLYENEFILLTIAEYQTERGSTLGTLIGITEKTSLQQLIQPLNGLAPFANTFFILSNNQFIASDATTGSFTLVDSTSSSQEALINSLMSMMSAGNLTPVAMDVTTPQGLPALAQMQWFPSMQSGVVLEIDSDKIYGQINSLIPFTLILLFAIGIATAYILRFGVRRVIQPLQSLASITRNFADGDWNQRADVASNDEVGLLANSFNHMADQLGDVYQSLEQKVDERTRQIRAAAEVAQSVTSIPNLDDMLNRTAELLVREFEFYQASIFITERNGKYVDFKTGYGPATRDLLNNNFRIEVGSASIIGWVASKNQSRIASHVSEDPLYLKNDLLPETKAEASVPISLGTLVLGVLDVQSKKTDGLSPDTLILLQTLASQIATAIQTAGLIESSQINFQELERLYRSSRLIAEASTEVDILNVGGQILRNAPYPIAIFKVERDSLKVISSADSTREQTIIQELPESVKISYAEVNDYLLRGITNANLIDSNTPKVLKEILQNLDLMTAVFLPIRRQDVLRAILFIGSRQQILSSALIQPYINLADLMTVSLERADAVEATNRHLREVEALASINDLIGSAEDIQNFYHNLLTKTKHIIGDYNLIVALYDEKTNTISIPFSYENGQVISIDSFPMGEGITSILIRTRQPMMIVEDAERRAVELGAKVAGKPSKSWMGAPMLINNNPIGALMLSDNEREHAFNEDDLKFFSTLAGQVAGVIHNASILDESKRRALQLETAAEIARDISGSLNLDELLVKAVNLIRERFRFYHASIFLLDLPGEFAVIREATGEAGTQLKRAGHKIGVGSKSIVGFVTGRGETLVVNDTNKDVTYYANPLLPDTRAEAAIPLQVGERILGALDVQSTKPYAFSEDNLRSLQILADQLAVAVANTELFAETQEHLSQHRLLHHITTSAASGTTLEEALDSAVKGLQVTLGGDRVMILLTDRDKKTLDVKASVGYAEDITSNVEFGRGVTGWVAAHKRPLRVRDVSEDPRYIEFSANTRSELAVPLIYRSELLGVLNVESEQTDAYTENDEEMLGTLGGSLAAVIANARLFEQIRAQADRERLIYDVTNKIRRSTDIQSILMTTASEITRVTGARYTKIQVKPKDNQPKDSENGT
jgi:GAF domain-containing protein/HAMP domain-containing protein